LSIDIFTLLNNQEYQSSITLLKKYYSITLSKLPFLQNYSLICQKNLREESSTLLEKGV
jgi:hypothetical protein